MNRRISSTSFSFLLFLLLLLFTGCSGRGRHMLAELERAEEMNRSDIPFTSDSLGKELVRYYDHWWHSPLLRLRAYYMLGSAYRDMGEAPAALHYYNIAVQQADTTKADSATYATLFRVYGQMALIYEQQNMPQEELEALSSVCRYALLSGDTISHILGYAHMTVPYYVINDTTNLLRITEKAYHLFRNSSRIQDAARVLSVAIYVNLLNGNLSRARHYMDIFERESGLFDQTGHIEAGREQYYENKGLYYVKKQQPDSAEFFYRKLLSYGYQYEAYNGLLLVYAMTGKTDSVMKYTSQYEMTLGEWVTSRQTDAIIQSSAMYKYERHQRIAEQEKQEAETFKFSTILLLLILLLIMAMSTLIYQKAKQKKEKNEMEYRRLVEEHQHIQTMHNLQCETLKRLEEEYATLQQKNAVDIASYNQILAKKGAEIERQREILNSYRQEVLERENRLLKEESVIDFQKMAINGYNGKKATKKDWDSLIRTFKKYMPHLYAKMKVALLTGRELRVCILTFLEFSPSDMVILMDVSKQIVSNLRLSSKRKLFGTDESLSLIQCLKKCAYFQE